MADLSKCSRCEAHPIDASRTLSERQVQEQREAQTVREAVPDEQQERPVDRPGSGQQLAGFEQQLVNALLRK